MTTYAVLTSDTIARSVRDDLTAVIPSFIRTAESKINRKVRVPTMIQSTTLVVPDTGIIALPARFLALRSLALQADIGLGQTAELNYLPPDQFHEKNLNSNIYAGSTRDAFYTFEGDNLHYLPKPGSGETATLAITYWQGFDTLDATVNTTNWLLTNHFDIYLWATLADLADYIDDDAMQSKYELKLQNDINDLHRSESRKMRGRPQTRSPGRVTP